LEPEQKDLKAINKEISSATERGSHIYNSNIHTYVSRLIFYIFNVKRSTTNNKVLQNCKIIRMKIIN